MRGAREGGRATVEVQVAYLLEPEAAAYLRVAPDTLRRWRSDGLQKGPRFRHHGGVVVYAVRDLDRWSELHAATSTLRPAEEGPQTAAG